MVCPGRQRIDAGADDLVHHRPTVTRHPQASIANTNHAIVVAPMTPGLGGDGTRPGVTARDGDDGRVPPAADSGCVPEFRE